MSEKLARHALTMASVPVEVFEAWCAALRRRPQPEDDPALFELAAKLAREPGVTATDGGNAAPVATRNASLLWCSGGLHEIENGAPVVVGGRVVSIVNGSRGLRYDRHWCLAHLAGNSPKAEDFGPCDHCARQCVVYVKRPYAPRAPWVRNKRRWRPEAGISLRVFCSSLCKWRQEGKRRSKRRAWKRAGRTCPECEAVFDPSRSDAITCSVACRMRAHRRRAAEELAIRRGGSDAG